MSNLLITGGHVLTPAVERFANVVVRNGRVAELSSSVSDNERAGNGAGGSYRKLDATGCYVTPGLVDLQVNGDPNCNLWGDPSEGEMRKMRKALARAGVTSFLPTLITDDLDHLKKNVALLTSWGAGIPEKWSNDSDGARMVGIHLEGPCLSPQRPGVHPPRHIAPPTVSLFQQIVNGSVRLVTMACELDKGSECVKWLARRNVFVSLGHSNANYDEAQSAFDAGVRVMTHTFNALPPVHHREPGAVSAALLDRRVSCCVIADGLHLSPQAVDIVYRMKGLSHIILVTDIAHIGTTGGGLLGSSITLDTAVRNVVNWGIAGFREAVVMASHNAAAAIGLSGEIGIIEPGALADLVIWDKNTLEIKHVVAGGAVIA